MDDESHVLSWKIWQREHDKDVALGYRTGVDGRNAVRRLVDRGRPCAHRTQGHDGLRSWYRFDTQPSRGGWQRGANCAGIAPVRSLPHVDTTLVRGARAVIFRGRRGEVGGRTGDVVDGAIGDECQFWTIKRDPAPVYSCPQ